MKTSEYIRRKNAIIEKATGIILVPEDQIIDIEPMKLRIYSDWEACPYCMTFESCSQCPMEQAGNSCDSFDLSVRKEPTYRRVEYELNGSIVNSVVREELEALIDEYNKSNGF